MAFYRVLTREELATLSGPERRRTVGVEEALRCAVRNDALRQLEGNPYAIASYERF
jgi:hypothetical protein